MANKEGKEHPKIFISYSHKDEEWMQRVAKHFQVLEKQDMLCAWDDTKIHVGDDWLEQIENALDCVSVAILLISTDFLTSNFILEKEVPLLLERRQKEGGTCYSADCKAVRVEANWVAKTDTGKT